MNKSCPKCHCICIIFVEMNKVSRISQNLYAMLNMIIGDDITIHINRTTTDLEDDVRKMVLQEADEDAMLYYTGSKAEGFRFKSSDDDFMIVYKNIRIVPSVSFISMYDSNVITLLIMDNTRTKPGFSLLKLRNTISQHFLRFTTENLFNEQYVSSKLWRELHFAASANQDIEFTHGPCISGALGILEYDLAHTLKCDIWPHDAHDCIKRLQKCRWPSHDTIRSIVIDGVLFVPIGARGSRYENTEWRMSFSLAEKKLIHAMSHTQFLCYGLLKIFLKEAINNNPQVNGLLCS